MSTVVDELTSAIAAVQAALDAVNATEVPATPVVPEKDQVRVVVENVLTSEGWVAPAEAVSIPVVDASETPVDTPVDVPVA